MPDVDAAQKELAIGAYVGSIEGINSESGKSQRFTLLLHGLFGVEPGFIEEYVQGIEKYLKAKGKDRIIRGQADQLSGNLIIEFEREIVSKPKLDEAEGQLRQYAACAWSQEQPGQRTKYLCLATDGRRFRAYAPIPKDAGSQTIDPDDVRLVPLESIDAAKLLWQDFYYFLDRYLLRKEILHPSSEPIVKDFGPKSHAFQVAEAALLRLWQDLKGHPDYCVLYEAWDKYLRIVYGSALADEALFVRHTYLAMLAKLTVWSRLAGTANHPTQRDTVAILEGSYFKSQLGIENFMEEDFFSWVARKEARDMGMEIARLLLGLLRNYNLREISEDVLKALYEGLVDPTTRHDLGEYYTPDWLAHRLVRRLLEPNPEATVLDLACGSGTFLYMTIREKRRLLGDSAATLKHILSAVVGMDIHPLACIVAKANYVLALGDLMVKRKQKVAIPVYLANSIRPPEMEVQPQLWHKVKCYKTEIDSHEVHIPETLIKDSEKYDQAIEAAHEFAVHSRGKRVDAKAFSNFLRTHYAGLLDDEDAADVLFTVAETLKTMIEAGRDTIWAFVLKNIYKPLFLKERFDLVVGNPPWLSYRYVERSDYQAFLKEQITKVYGLVTGRAELVTHLELGTLFLARSADLYLKMDGRIGFVLPKSIFSADQHDALRRGRVRISIQEKDAKTGKPREEIVSVVTECLWDLEGVTPLFKTASAVLIGRKAKAKGKVGEPISGEVLAGELPLRNATLEAAERALRFQEVPFNLSVMGTRSYWSTGLAVNVAGSPYKDLFVEGASIVPRCFWLVDLKVSEYGFDANLPPLISSEAAQKLAKPAYKGCVIEGNVESQFIYATLLPADMVPFGFLRLQPVVLPAIVHSGDYRLRDVQQARHEGFIHLAAWIERAAREWQNRRGEKAGNLTVLGRLDYVHGLTRQKANARFRVLYAMSGTHICACVVDSKVLDKSAQTGLKPQGFACDYKTYFCESADPQEIHYLAAVLNANSVNKAIKPAQSRGLWGPRDVCKKALDLPIPKFDPAKKEHVRLAEIGEACAKRVKKWSDSGGPGNARSIGRLRSNVREMLKAELAEIDAIVKPMLGL
jgi:methylase of polypeptide subunit release factors